MKNNKLIKSLAAMTLAASLFAGAASLVSAADNNRQPEAGTKVEENKDGNVIDFKNPGSGEQDVPENRPEDPKPANPNAKDVPGNGQKPEPDGEKAPSSTDKKEEAPAVKKALPKTSALK